MAAGSKAQGEYSVNLYHNYITLTIKTALLLQCSMKKITLILLISIYAFSTFGLSLKEFYCCGKLKSIAVSVTYRGNDKWSKTGCNDGCCKTKYQYVKIKDNHLATGEVTIPVNYFSDLFSENLSFQRLSFISPQVNIINGCHAPPLHSGVPVYISNCVFRI